MGILPSNARCGVFVDGQHVSRCGGRGLRYDVLREFAARDGAELLRMNVYLPWEEARAAEDAAYRRGQENFAATLRDFGYKVIRRTIRREGDAGTLVAMAVDCLSQSENLERVLLLTGDEEFVDVARALQARGCRVEAIGLEGASAALRAEVDTFFPAHLVPGLLPVPHQEREAWGRSGSRVRGVCYNHSGKGYGFLRYVREAGPGMWIMDSRHPDSPYETVFFHDSQLPEDVAFHQLPSRDFIFEFELTESDRYEDDLQAINLRLVGRLGGHAAPREGGEAFPEEAEGDAENGEDWSEDGEEAFEAQGPA